MNGPVDHACREPGDVYCQIFNAWAVVLALTAVAKALDVAGSDSYLREHDRLLQFLTRRQTLISAVCLEVAVCVFIWFGETVRQKAYALAWFCTVAATYKLGLIMTYETRPCSCLGVVGKALALSAAQLEVVTWSLLVLMGGTPLLLLFGRKRAGVGTG